MGRETGLIKGTVNVRNEKDDQRRIGEAYQVVERSNRGLYGDMKQESRHQGRGSVVFIPRKHSGIEGPVASSWARSDAPIATFDQLNLSHLSKKLFLVCRYRRDFIAFDAHATQRSRTRTHHSASGVSSLSLMRCRVLMPHGSAVQYLGLDGA